jgi:hypothetical protein
MRRLFRAVRFGLLNGLILCIAVAALHGYHNGWDSVRLSNPPLPEVGFFLALAAIQTVFGWAVIPPDGGHGKHPTGDF